MVDCKDILNVHKPWPRNPKPKYSRKTQCEYNKLRGLSLQRVHCMRSYEEPAHKQGNNGLTDSNQQSRAPWEMCEHSSCPTQGLPWQSGGSSPALIIWLLLPYGSDGLRSFLIFCTQRLGASLGLCGWARKQLTKPPQPHLLALSYLPQNCKAGGQVYPEPGGSKLW